MVAAAAAAMEGGIQGILYRRRRFHLLTDTLDGRGRVRERSRFRLG